MLIVVTGNDGVGKTTYARMLADRLNGAVVPEPYAENPFGLDYLRDPRSWTYQAEVEFIRRRASAVRTLIALRRPIVCDRYVWDDVEIFARLWTDLGVLESRELESLRALALDLTRDLPQPTWTVWLRASIESMTARIALRGIYPQALTLKEITSKRERLYEAWLAGRPDTQELDTTRRSLKSLQDEADRTADLIQNRLSRER